MLRSSILSAFSLVNPTRINHLLFFKKIKKKIKKEKEKKKETNKSVCGHIIFFSLFHSLPQFFFPPLSPTTTKQCRHPPDAHHLVNLPVWSFRSVFFFLLFSPCKSLWFLTSKFPSRSFCFGPSKFSCRDFLFVS